MPWPRAPPSSRDARAATTRARRAARPYVPRMRGLATTVAAACAFVVACAEPRPPPPPPRILSAQEAVDIGARFARSRGLVVERTLAARLDRRARWHVDLVGAGGRDRAAVVLDGYTGRVLNARLRGAGGESYAPSGPGAPSPPPPPAQGAPPQQGAPPPEGEGPDTGLPPVPPPAEPPPPPPPAQ
jgi:hypothetical protein